MTSAENHGIAQEDIDALNDWEREWLLKFNVKDGKCKVLHVGTKNPRMPYYMNGELLPETTSEKDLGVLTSANLHWDNHIRASIKKAKSVIGWVTRNVISRSREVMLNIFKSIIRPHVEYAVQIWNLPASHGNWKLILEIEDVQRSFTRLIDGIGLLTYEKRLEELQLTTLLERRMRGDLIEAYKIITRKVSYGNELFRMSRSGMNILKDSRGDVLLSNRCANYWNKLPETVKNATSVNSFKHRLDKYKEETSLSSLRTPGHYWELSSMIFEKLGTNSNGRDAYVQYMKSNPKYAKRRGINIC